MPEPIDTEAVRRYWVSTVIPDRDSEDLTEILVAQAVDAIGPLCDALDAASAQLEQRNRDVNDTGEELFTAVETNRRLQAELTAARTREAEVRLLLAGAGTALGMRPRKTAVALQFIEDALSLVEQSELKERIQHGKRWRGPFDSRAQQS